jgi:hypothetical protein
MNKFDVRCPGCGHFMVDAIVAGFSLLMHPGERSSPTCLSSIPYVLFTANQEVCNHCCPETFAQCQVCYRGTPTKQPCRST